MLYTQLQGPRAYPRRLWVQGNIHLDKVPIHWRTWTHTLSPISLMCMSLHSERKPEHEEETQQAWKEHENATYTNPR